MCRLPSPRRIEKNSKTVYNFSDKHCDSVVIQFRTKTNLTHSFSLKEFLKQQKQVTLLRSAELMKMTKNIA